MELKTDEKAFDKLQLFLAKELAGLVKSDLERAGLAGQDLFDATQQIAFSVAAMIDGSTVMHLDGDRVQPVLTFEATDGQSLISAGAGSWMHEYIGGMVDDAFGVG